jgi:methylated-DNA-protein-cysteine methyltransferase related protein
VDEVVAERVLRAVELVPTGRVVSYGDLAELVGGTPRQVGAVMRLRGSEVPWWRVVSSYGDLPRHLRDEVRPIWLAEGIRWKANGLGCRIDDHRCDLVQLADDYERTLADHD